MRKHASKRMPLLIGGITVLLGGGLFCFGVGSALTAAHPGTVILPEQFAGTAVTFGSSSGAALKGNLLVGTKGSGAIILMHGVRGNRGAMAKHAIFLKNAGFSVFLFDFQAHGESTGSKITSGYLESMDAAAAVTFIRERLPGERIGVIGSSLGGAAVILAEPALKVDAAVLELVYPDIERAVKNRIEIVLGGWARPFSVLLTTQLRPRIGVNEGWFSPVHKIRELNCPKLIIGGGKDRHTKPQDTKDLFENAVEPKELWLVDRASHEDIHAIATEEYEQRVKEFFRRHLQK